GTKTLDRKIRDRKMEANDTQAQEPSTLQPRRSFTADFTDFADKKGLKNFTAENARNAEWRGANRGNENKVLDEAKTFVRFWASVFVSKFMSSLCMAPQTPSVSGGGLSDE